MVEKIIGPGVVSLRVLLLGTNADVPELVKTRCPLTASGQSDSVSAVRAVAKI